MLALRGVNKLTGKDPAIPVEKPTAKLETCCDRLEEWMPSGTRIVLSTVAAGNEAKGYGNPHRNERHRLYGEQAIKPVVEHRIATENLKRWPTRGAKNLLRQSRPPLGP